MMAGKDTKTRYQGVYKRHESACSLTVAQIEGRELSDSACDCNGNFFGVAWDKRAGKTRKTRHLSKAVAARNARVDLVASLRTGRPVGTSAMRFDAAVEKFKEAIEAGTALTNKGRRYRDDAAKDLKGTLGHLPDEWKSRRFDGGVTAGDVQTAVDEWIADGLSSSRIRSRVYALSSLYRWGRGRERTTADPTADIQLPANDSKPRDRVATPCEFNELMGPLKLADQVAYSLAAYGSARASEIRRLDWTDVDFDHLVMLLSASGGKSAAARRIVPIGRPLLLVLKAAWLKQGRPKAGKVCPPRKFSKSGEMSTSQLLKRCYAAWDKANIDERKEAKKEGRKPNILTPINLHECRHTCATWLDHAGVSPKVNSQWMGHSTPERQPGAAPITLNRYTHVLAGELERARDQLDAFLTERTAAKIRSVK